jgi:hypothetical protein
MDGTESTVRSGQNLNRDRKEMTMNTKMNSKPMPVAQVLVAGVAALALTWVSSWGFVDSTRVARWVNVGQAAVAVVASDAGRTAGGAIKSTLLQ